MFVFVCDEEVLFGLDHFSVFVGLSVFRHIEIFNDNLHCRAAGIRISLVILYVQEQTAIFFSLSGVNVMTAGSSNMVQPLKQGDGSAGGNSDDGDLFVDVLVLGAGAAGIAAARKLQQTNKRVVVLEARNRVGGRAWTVEQEIEGKVFSLDLGCQWVHGGCTEQTQHPAWLLAKEMGVGLFPTNAGGLWAERRRRAAALLETSSGQQGVQRPESSMQSGVGANSCNGRKTPSSPSSDDEDYLFDSSSSDEDSDEELVLFGDGNGPRLPPRDLDLCYSAGTQAFGRLFGKKKERWFKDGGADMSFAEFAVARAQRRGWRCDSTSEDTTSTIETGGRTSGNRNKESSVFEKLVLELTTEQVDRALKAKNKKKGKKRSVPDQHAAGSTEVPAQNDESLQQGEPEPRRDLLIRSAFSFCCAQMLWKIELNGCHAVDRASVKHRNTGWTLKDWDDSDVEGGYGRLVGSAAAGLDVRLNTVVQEVRRISVQQESSDRDSPPTMIEVVAVKKIDSTTDRLQDPCSAVGADESSQTEKIYFRARHCVVALPLGVLRNGDVLFQDDLVPESVQRVVAGGPAVAVFNKLILGFRHRWWEKSNSSQNNVRQISLLGADGVSPTWHPFSWMWVAEPVDDHTSGVAALVCFLTGAFAEHLETLGDEQACDLCLAALRKAAHGRSVEKPLFFRMTRWRSDPFARGSWTYFSNHSGGVPDLEVFQEANKAAADGSVKGGLGEVALFFAGEHTADGSVKGLDHQTCHGAWKSGEVAADWVLQRMEWDSLGTG